jgi:hypothetical protein
MMPNMRDPIVFKGDFMVAFKNPGLERETAVTIFPSKADEETAVTVAWNLSLDQAQRLLRELDEAIDAVVLSVPPEPGR